MGFTYQRTLKRHELRLLQPIILSHNFLSFRSLVVPRTGAPPYTAVSYTWGDEPPSQTIQLDGQSFSVRLNLWSCLHYISSHARNAGVEYLWADAICINQNDTDERSAQVSLMDQTYANASFVSVWLGLPTLPEHLWDQIPQHEPIRTLDSDGIDFHDSMADLANRPYWSRFWVIQEFLLGKDAMLYCSNTGMNWLDFKTILCMEVGIDETRSMDQLNDRVGGKCLQSFAIGYGTPC
ncbi:heterokaryon incompatibility protein-domain-containing protein [Dactylonectria macrodidyma]|uniref:Heterokaryon incompatibility protein-domain-containing protein n=1 Tax=Dactylonectria macrodidyma TaxID=307937 RepID=A0A9P9ISA0_9HYPO|nr:heterokaryon incompatibility protein-domain-containing protein [Dactylonectria macrodidyma]